MKKEDRIYFAAYLDGEGSIGIYRNKGSKDPRYKSGHKTPCWVRSVSISSTNHSVLEDVMQSSGLGAIHALPRNKQYKQQYQWQIGAKADIVSFLDELLPYLREKLGQAVAMIAECEGKVATEATASFLKASKR